MAIIQSSTMLTRLQTSHTGITSTGLIQISRWMLSESKDIQLQHLDISKNVIGDNGMKAFCSALKSCSQMQTVNVSACQLGSTSGRYILSMVEAIANSKVSCNQHHSLQVSLMNSHIPWAVCHCRRESLECR